MAADKEFKTLDYNAVLADLEARKAALEHAIASLKVIMRSGVLIGKFVDSMPPMADNVAVGIHGGDVPVGAFLGKSIPEAAKLCLQIVKRKLTSREIAEFLKKGGIETTAKNFPTQVHSILTRATKSHTSPILKLDRSYWGLADWYPTGLRSSGNADKRVEKRGRKRRRGRLAKLEDGPKLLSGPSPTSRIVQVLKSKPGAEFSPQDVAAPANVSPQVAALTLGRLVAAKQAEKTSSGKYRASVVN